MGMLLVTIFCLVPLGLDARPISYPGGSTIMAFSDNRKNSIYYHYSPSYKYSIGIENINDKVFSNNYSYARFTCLLKRKNSVYSQRNLYFQSGISSKGLDNYFYGVHGDWETRRWSFFFGLKQVENKIKDYKEQYYKFGIAPYLGDYGDFHTWIIVKIKEDSLDNKWSTYPVLQSFKGNVLMGVGYNNDTEWDVHLMYRF